MVSMKVNSPMRVPAGGVAPGVRCALMRGRSPERPEEVVPTIRKASTPPTAGPILMDVLLSE